MTEDEKIMAKKMPVIDIVMTHKNRLENLKRTLDYLWKRTKSKYTLSISDDGSTDGSQEYLIDLFHQGKLKNLVLHSKSMGYYSNINGATGNVTTPYFVFMTDDTLVPDVEPDWLQRLWQELDRCIPMGMIGLNNPTQPILPFYLKDKTETIQFTDQICSNVILFRNKPDIGYGDLPFKPLSTTNPKLADEMTPFSVNCIASGHTLGYLFDTYTCHIGEKSTIGVYENDEYPKKTFIKVDPRTLEPLEEYRE